MPYYAVHKGRSSPNVYNTWPECKREVDGLVGAVYKKFDTMEEAQQFMKQGFAAGSKPKGLIRHEKYESDNKDEIDAVLNAPDAHRNIIAYTDGSCIRQDGRVYCGYGIVIPDLNVKISEPLNDTKLTNNRAEMRAILHAIEIIPDEMKATKRICIFTDSQYCKYIFQGTGERYERDGFMKRGEDGQREEVPNKDMIKTALSYLRAFEIAILKVRAHTGAADVHSSYNDMADQLANKGAFKTKPGTKAAGPSTLIESLKAGSAPRCLDDGAAAAGPPLLPLPFPKKTAPVVSSTGEFDNSYRYNEKSDWREEEKKKFANKTKLSDVFHFTDDDEDDQPDAVSEPIPKPGISVTKPKVTAKAKPKTFTNKPLSDFISFEPSSSESSKKSSGSSRSKTSSISSFFTDDD